MGKAATGGPAAVDVALVSMPYAPPQRPSLALGILKAALAEGGIAARALYPALRFADAIGLDVHELLSRPSCNEGLIEWLFSPLAFPEMERDDAHFLERLILRNPRFPIRNPIRLAAVCGRARLAARAIIDSTVDEIVAMSPRVVGCTSMFQQHVASLALLRRIKAVRPDIVTIMGGPNCETRMGLATHRHYPWVDFVVSGEAEDLIVPLMRDLIDQGTDLPIEKVPEGVFAPVHRSGGYPSTKSGDGVPRASAREISHIALPNHDDYFDTLGQVSFRERIVPSLPFETARGCWWGATQHCTFCGLNGTSMTFRSKPGDQVANEIRMLYDRYGVASMNAVDNIIDLKYFETLFPALRDTGPPIRLFYETKSNLRRRHLVSAREARVAVLQPGIESLSTPALAYMRKGVQAWQNIQYLRLASEQGIRTIWLNLVAFPGEDDDWHARAATLFPLLSHLEPGMVTRVRYDRYSPLFRDATADPANLRLRPAECYQHIYPVSGADLFDQSYFFESVEETRQDDDEGPWIGRQPEWLPGAAALYRAAEAWKREWKRGRPYLAMIDQGERLAIEDTRACAPIAARVLTGIDRTILLATDEAPVEIRLREQLAREQSVDEAAISAAFDRLIAAKLLLPLDGRLLALPTLGRARPFAPPESYPLGAILPKENIRDAAE